MCLLGGFALAVSACTLVALAGLWCGCAESVGGGDNGADVVVIQVGRFEAVRGSTLGQKEADASVLGGDGFG